MNDTMKKQLKYKREFMFILRLGRDMTAVWLASAY